MVLLVDDIITLPGTIGKIILNTLAQTVQKVAWAEYSRDLKKLLLQARHDYDEQKISQEQFREVESYVFAEMRAARKVVSGKDS
jgi:Fe-S cluster biosynthesis and repair protein YggX